MYKKQNLLNSMTTIRCNPFYEGESIETKVRRITENKEPISDSAPTLYTNRTDGVVADYNIRTDRWDIAIDAMEKVAKAKTAQRDEKEKPTKTEKTEGEGEPNPGE